MSNEKNSKLQKISVPILIFLFLIFLLFPLYWMFITSLKGNSVLFNIPPQWFPFEPVLTHYKVLFSDKVFVNYYVNTLIVTIGTTFLTLFLAMLAGYGFSRFKFKSKDFAMF